MNTKIFSLLTKNLHSAFALAKYAKITIGPDTVVQDLPWTPARFRKFKNAMEKELQLSGEYIGTVQQITADFDRRYTQRFFGEIWKPRTQDYDWSGWQLVDEINALKPHSVLDVGCGYHPFKGRINNLIGIDPYNNCADYMVDISDYVGQHDVVLALGSINFNSQDEIELRFVKCLDVLTQGGKFYLRVNPGIPHQSGPYVDVFPWTFAMAKNLAEQHNLRLETFKQETNSRLYFCYTKL